MYYIISSLITIRFRKHISRNDKTASALVVLFFLAVALICYSKFNEIGLYFYLLFLDPILYHQKRNDLELLKIRKNYKWILFVEYIIYTFPYLIILIIKQKYYGLILVLMVNFIIIHIPKLQMKIIKYPFDLFNPHWHITFRNYKIILWFPLLLVLSFMGIKHQNPNIQNFVLLIIAIIICIPSFERERIEEIKYHSNNSKNYLKSQFINSLINTSFIIVPIAVFILFNTFNLLISSLILVVYVLPLVNIISKYAFFHHPIKLQLFLVFMIVSLGIPILSLPFLLNKALKNLNEIKNVENRN